MSNYMVTFNAEQLLEAWQKVDIINSNDLGRLRHFIQAQQPPKELPLYLRILVAVGAFIASLSFIGFLKISKIIRLDSPYEMIFWGMFFVVVALFLAKISKDKDKIVKQSLFMQVSFCSIGVGKIFFIFGCAELLDKVMGGWGVTFATFILTLATYHIYQMSIDRFLSTLAVFVLLLINILSERYFAISIESILNLLFFIQIILAAILLTDGSLKRDYIPLAYATACSLCIMIILFTFASKFVYWENKQPYSLAFINSILALSLIGLIGWVADDWVKLKKEPLALAVLGAVILGILSLPGVILSICLMVLGYAKHEKLLLLMGILLMPMFMFIYYYNLDISLLAKSVTLVTSGMILLAGRIYMSSRKLDQEVV